MVEAPVVAPAPAPVEAPAPPPPPPAPAAAVPAPSPLKDVFFNFDKAAIRDDQKAALNDNVGWLKGNTGAKVLVEGHCDERGTAEYNLALGERRAKAVKDYLVAAGIAADRISTITYGKERPFVLGHDESAWKWNRRAHFVAPGAVRGVWPADGALIRDRTSPSPGGFTTARVNSPGHME